MAKNYGTIPGKGSGTADDKVLMAPDGWVVPKKNAKKARGLLDAMGYDSDAKMDMNAGGKSGTKINISSGEVFLNKEQIAELERNGVDPRDLSPGSEHNEGYSPGEFNANMGGMSGMIGGMGGAGGGGGMNPMDNMEEVDKSEVKPKGLPGKGGGLSNIPVIGGLFAALSHNKRVDQATDPQSDQRKQGRNVVRAMGYPAPNLSEGEMSAKKGGRAKRPKNKKYTYPYPSLANQNNNLNSTNNNHSESYATGGSTNDLFSMGMGESFTETDPPKYPWMRGRLESETTGGGFNYGQLTIGDDGTVVYDAAGEQGSYGLPNAGYNQRPGVTNLEQAITAAPEDFGPYLETRAPHLQEGAFSFMYGTGKDSRIYTYDQMMRQRPADDPTRMAWERTDYGENKDMNQRQYFGRNMQGGQWQDPNRQGEFDALWDASGFDVLSPYEQRQLQDAGRSFYYDNTKSKKWANLGKEAQSMQDEIDPSVKIDLGPDPASAAVWSPRIDVTNTNNPYATPDEYNQAWTTAPQEEADEEITEATSTEEWDQVTVNPTTGATTTTDISETAQNMQPTSLQPGDIPKDWTYNINSVQSVNPTSALSPDQVMSIDGAQYEKDERGYPVAVTDKTGMPVDKRVRDWYIQQGLNPQTINQSLTDAEGNPVDISAYTLPGATVTADRATGDQTVTGGTNVTTGEQANTLPGGTMVGAPGDHANDWDHDGIPDYVDRDLPPLREGSAGPENKLIQEDGSVDLNLTQSPSQLNQSGGGTGKETGVDDSWKDNLRSEDDGLISKLMDENRKLNNRQQALNAAAFLNNMMTDAGPDNPKPSRVNTPEIRSDYDKMRRQLKEENTRLSNATADKLTKSGKEEYLLGIDANTTKKNTDIEASITALENAEQTANANLEAQSLFDYEAAVRRNNEFNTARKDRFANAKSRANTQIFTETKNQMDNKFGNDAYLAKMQEDRDNTRLNDEYTNQLDKKKIVEKYGYFTEDQYKRMDPEFRDGLLRDYSVTGKRT